VLPAVARELPLAAVLPAVAPELRLAAVACTAVPAEVAAAYTIAAGDFVAAVAAPLPVCRHCSIALPVLAAVGGHHGND
jgi:hypothetical protein